MLTLSLLGLTVKAAALDTLSGGTVKGGSLEIALRHVHIACQYVALRMRLM